MDKFGCGTNYHTDSYYLGDVSCLRLGSSVSFLLSSSLSISFSGRSPKAWPAYFLRLFRVGSSLRTSVRVSLTMALSNGGELELCCSLSAINNDTIFKRYVCFSTEANCSHIFRQRSKFLARLTDVLCD